MARITVMFRNQQGESDSFEAKLTVLVQELGCSVDDIASGGGEMQLTFAVPTDEVAQQFDRAVRRMAKLKRYHSLNVHIQMMLAAEVELEAQCEAMELMWEDMIYDMESLAADNLWQVQTQKVKQKYGFTRPYAAQTWMADQRGVPYCFTQTNGWTDERVIEYLILRDLGLINPRTGYPITQDPGLELPEAIESFVTLLGQ